MQLSEYQQYHTVGFPFGKAHFHLHVCANRIEWKCTIDNIPLSSIAPRSEEERIEEFLEENDVLLKNQDKIPFKYISDIHYGKKPVWKNPDFEN